MIDQKRCDQMADAIREALASNMIGSNQPSVTISLAAYEKMIALFPKILPRHTA